MNSYSGLNDIYYIDQIIKYNLQIAHLQICFLAYNAWKQWDWSLHLYELTQNY